MLKKYYLGGFFWAPIQVKWYQNTYGFAGDMISSQQITYVKKRQIGEGGRLISDIIQITKIKKTDFLVTMDIEKVFDSLDHNFVILNLQKYGFGKNFISWVKILLRN